MAALMTATIAAPAVVVFTVVGLLVGQLVVGVLLGILVALALSAYVWRRSEDAVVRLVGAQPADPSTYPRYHNLVEGLCAAAGVAKISDRLK